MPKCLLFLSSCFWVAGAGPLPAAVVINEFLAANSRVNQDEQGDFDDWIELHNAGSTAVDVAGWFLTDELSQPTQWQFPTSETASTTIPAGGFLLIWADNEPMEGPLHASFKLDAGGEEIGLFAADGVTLLDRIEFDDQDQDHSYGRFPDGSAEWQVMSKPTPGHANIIGFLGNVADTKFSMDRGIYEVSGAFAVTISTRTRGADIYYTTDGSVPSPTNGVLYSGPIQINASTVLRAAAYKEGWRPSDVDTHTYLLNQSDAIRSLPVVSLVADPERTFGVQGLFADVLAQGAASEFPVSLEYLPPSNRGAQQQDAGIRLQGSSYRRRTIGPNPSAKWSFKIYFRDDYGDGETFRGKLVELSPLSEFPTVVLRSGYNDSANPFIKDELGRRLFADMGQPSSLGDFVNLFINGQLKNNGYYNPTERIDEKTLREKSGSDLEWDVVTKWQPSGTAADPPRTHNEPYLFDVRDGDHVSFAELLDYALTHDLAVAAHFDEMARRLDVVNFVDYLILQGYSRIRDWPQNNWNAARERSEGELGRWKFYAWDLEFGWGSAELTGTFKVPPSSSDNPLGILYHQLKVSPQFRQLFAHRAQAHFFNDGALTRSNVVRRFDEMRDVLAAVLPNMDTYIRDTYAAQRPGYVLNSLASLGLFTHESPRFLVDGRRQHGGEVAQGALLTMERPEGTGTIYYSLDGGDPTNHIFSGSLALNETVLVKARLQKSGVWSGLVKALFRVHPLNNASNLVVTEIHYHPARPQPAEVSVNPELTAGDFEFVELANRGSAPLDLPGTRFLDGVDYVFPDDGIKTLAPGDRVVLAKNPDALTLRYGAISNLAGPYRGQLSNGGERLEWANAEGDTIGEVRFRDDWYPITDGHGFSLVAAAEESMPASRSTKTDWRPSRESGGSPGEADPAPLVAPRVVINEVLTHSELPDVDAIELRNLDMVAAELSGWFLTDDFDVPQKFRIPDGTLIPPDGYLVFTETDFNRPGSPGRFSLSSMGEEVYLFSADAAGELTGYLQGFDFGAAASRVSLGRTVISTGEEFLVPQEGVSLGTNNPGPAAPRLVISEIMYHPRDLLIGSTPADNVVEEFIELQNPSDAPVTLFDPDFPTNTWRISGAVQFEFPTNQIVAPGDFLLLVGFDPERDQHLVTSFRSRYGLPASVALYGPFGGKLNDSDERINLSRPEAPRLPPALNAGEVPWIIADQVRYSDTPPWPPGADGTGLSLQRVSSLGFGNEPTNWIASTPTPGAIFLMAEPIIVQAPADQSVVEGGDLTISMGITGGPPPFMYLLRRGLLPLTSLILHERTCFFTLTNIQMNEGGLHQLVVTNAAVPSSHANTTFILTVLRDSDGDGLPDEWETAHGLYANEAHDAALDLDGDGVSNRDEYEAGTDPGDSRSVLQIEWVSAEPEARLAFRAMAHKTYTVLYANSLPPTNWTKLEDVLAPTNDVMIQVIDPDPPDERFYRLVTPRQP